MKLLLVMLATIFTSLQITNAEESFILIGDTGKANETQVQVANAIDYLCQSTKCDHGILLGDNIYPAGMNHENDQIMDLKFGDIYKHLTFNFYAVLGNHDYGKLTRAWKKGQYQIEYSKKNPQFILPHFYYVQEFENVVIAFIDTTRLMWNKDYKIQKDIINKARVLASEKNKFLIVAGHHPYLSNGEHGNAGTYEGKKILPYFASGKFVKKFLDENVCKYADLYLSGHDHNLQVFDGTQIGCKGKFIVSGAGASTTKLIRKTPAIYQSEVPGFFILKTSKNSLNYEAYSENLEMLYKN